MTICQAGIGQHRGDRPRELRLEPRRLLALGTLDHLIQRLHRDALSRGPQVHPLPRTPSLDALRVVEGVANSQGAESRGGWQLGIARGGEPSLVRLFARYRNQLAKQPENVSIPAASSVTPSLRVCSSLQLVRYQAKSSAACAGSAMIASVARRVRSENVRLASVLVNQIKATSGLDQ